MVFAPVDPEIKEKIITAYLSGQGRNQIERQLKEEGVKVSRGSISNFINSYKKKQQSLKSNYTNNEQLIQSHSTINPAAPLDKTGSPTSSQPHGVGLVTTIHRNSNHSSEEMDKSKTSLSIVY